jgi:TP901 family phage tail tape measure protein
MPDLGKAVYTLAFDTRQGEVAVAGMEARADAAATNISKSMGMAEKSIIGTGEAATVAEGQLTLFGTEGSAAMEKVGASAKVMGAEVDAAATVAATGAKKTSAAWYAAGGTMAAIGKRMKSIGKSMTRTITLPTLLVAGYGADQFLKYGQKITLLKTQAGATTTEVNRMRGAILNLAKGTSQGPTELANAMFRVESDIKRVNGRVATASDKLNILKQAANGAEMGIANLDDTTYALVGTMNSGIRGSETASKTMATLSSIVGQGDMHLQDLTAALSTGVIPQTVLANMRLTDLGAALAVMTSRNIPAQKSATWLGTAFSMLMKPTKQMADAFNQLGMGSMDMARIMRQKGLGAALAYFNVHLSKVKDKTERARIALAALGGQKSGKALLLLTTQARDYAERWNAINKGVSNYNNNVALAKQDPINKLKTAWSGVQVALIKIGAIVVPILVRILNGLAKIADAFGKLPHFVQVGIVAFGLLLAAVGPLLVMFASVIRAITVIGTLLGSTFVADAAAAVGGILTLEGALAVGLVGAAVAAGIALGLLLDKLKFVRDAGSWVGKELYKVTTWAGITQSGNGTPGQNADLALGSKGMQYVQSRYKALRAGGATDAQAIATLQKQHPNLDIGFLVHSPNGTVMRGLAPGSSTAKKGAKKGKKGTDPLSWKDVLGIGKNDNGGGGGSGVGKNGEFLPQSLQLALLNAAGPGGSPAQVQAVLKKQLAWLEAYKTSHKLTGAKLVKLLTEINSVYSQIQTVTKKMSGGSILGMVFARLSDAYLKAEHTKSLTDDKKALLAEESFLTRLLKQHSLSEKMRHAALTALHKVDTALASLSKKVMSQKNQAFNDRIAIEMAQASLLGGKAGASKLSKIQKEVREHELKLLTAEENSIRRRLKDRTLSLHQQAQLWKQLAAVDKKRLALAKQIKNGSTASEKEIQAALNDRGTFFGQFAPNIFTPGSNGLLPGAQKPGPRGGRQVTQNNTFNEIPRDRFKLSQQLKHAAVHATSFDG